MAKEAYYFSHDANARHDPKIKALVLRYGMSGYGCYWVIVEMMREQGDYRLPKKAWMWSAIASELIMTPEQAESFVTDCVNEFELFQADDTHFWSDSLMRRMKKRESFNDQMRENGKKGGRPRNEQPENQNETRMKPDDNQQVTENNQPVSNENQSESIKGKEIKGNKINEIETNVSIFKEDYPDDFESFCAEYPKDVDRAKAYAVFEKLKLQFAVKADALIRAASAYSLECEKKSTAETYISDAHNFLAKGKWRDYLTKPVRPPELDRHCPVCGVIVPYGFACKCGADLTVKNGKFVERIA